MLRRFSATLIVFLTACSPRSLGPELERGPRPSGPGLPSAQLKEELGEVLQKEGNLPLATLTDQEGAIVLGSQLAFSSTYEKSKGRLEKWLVSGAVDGGELRCGDSKLPEQPGFPSEPMCVLTGAPSARVHRVHSPRPARANPAAIIKLLRKGKVQELAAFEERDLNRAFGKIKNAAELEQFFANLSETPGCFSIAVPLAAGLRLESEFPEPRAKARAKTYYGKTVECAKASGRSADLVRALKASYRLGLIQTWDGEFEAAAKTLDLVTNFKPRSGEEPPKELKDFRSRALFWQANAVEQLGHADQARAIRKTLMNDHSLSLHALLAFHQDGGRGNLPGAFLKQAAEPQVFFRSRKSSWSWLNRWLDSIEALVEVANGSVSRTDLSLRERERMEAKALGAAKQLVGQLTNGLIRHKQQNDADELGLPELAEEADPALANASRVSEEIDEFGQNSDDETDASEEEARVAAAPEFKQKNLEVEVQLYVAYLNTIVGDRLGSFRLMTELFRRDAALISESAVRLIYPSSLLSSIERVRSDLDSVLVLSLIRQESAFNTRARSIVGARGLMQLMPRTAWLTGRVTKEKLFDADANLKVGMRYFQQLVQRFGGEVEDALAGYNAGPERVSLWRNRYPVTTKLLFVDLIPFKETREYVASIARNYYLYRALIRSRDSLLAQERARETLEDYMDVGTSRAPAATREPAAFGHVFRILASVDADHESTRGASSRATGARAKERD